MRMNSGRPSLTALVFLLLWGFHFTFAQQWTPDNGDGTYTNPVLYADYSDPDVIRVGSDFYLVSSSFHESPGLPVLHSTDLVNWTIIGHALDTLPSAVYSRPQFGNGVWAPSIRFHNGSFYIYYGDPDFGIFMVRTKNIRGTWDAPVIVEKGKGLIDPCPLWDDKGDAYLAHAWAKSRAGFNSMLTVHRMNSEGTAMTDTGTFVFDAHEKHPTMEGPKFYQRNGSYYIFAPAGGVKTGWQTVLRGDSPFGPFKDSIVLQQMGTLVNGPHQGAWVDDIAGNNWFIHFQDKGAYGRIVHLQPMQWQNDWPVMGDNGAPLMGAIKSVSNKASKRIIPQTSDNFSSPQLGLQWQWNANKRNSWYSLSARKGALRLYAVQRLSDVNTILGNPSILLQKFPAPSFSVTVTMDGSRLGNGDHAGLIIAGMEYSALVLERTNSGMTLSQRNCTDVLHNGTETAGETIACLSSTIFLRADVDSNAVCRFSYSNDNNEYHPLGKEFTAQPGRWIGARVGLFALSSSDTSTKGSADVLRFDIR